MLFALLALEQLFKHFGVWSAGTGVREYLNFVGRDSGSAHARVQVPVVRDPVIPAKVSTVFLAPGPGRR